MTNQTTANTEIKNLRQTVTQIDNLSQDGCSEILTLAQFALAWLEKPVAKHNLESLVIALNMIRYKAEDMQNCINLEAEGVGCNYVEQRARFGDDFSHRTPVGA